MSTGRAEPASARAPISVLCQACGIRNSEKRRTCRRCGTLLLILSAPPSDLDDFDETAAIEEQGDLEENIFERITSLEDGLRHLSEALAATAEHLGQLEHNLTVTHAGIESLSNLLESQGVVSRAEIVDGWERTVGRELRSRDLSRRFRDRCRRVLSQATHDNHDSAGFRDRLVQLEASLIAPDLQSALETMADLTELAPGNDELWGLLGETAFELGELEIAFTAFSQAHRLRGPHLETLIYLGTVASDLERWDEAERALLAARELAPESFLPHFSLGAMASLRARTNEAIEHLRSAVSREAVPQAAYLLGVNYLRQGRPGLAIRAFRSAIDLDPSFEDALYQLGVAYLRRGWSRRALDTFEAVLKLDPRRLRYQETVRLFSLSANSDYPDETGNLVKRAEATLTEGRHEHAYRLFVRAARSAPNHPELQATAALLAASIGRTREAISHAHRLLRDDRGDSPYLAAAVAALLDSLRQAQRFTAARRLALRFATPDQNHLVRGIAAYEYALVAIERGEDLAAARAMARDALEFTPRELLHFPLAALGAMALKERSFREARRFLEQAVETAPAPDLMRQLAIACLGAGDREGAELALAAIGGAPLPDLSANLMGHLRNLSELRNELKGSSRGGR